MTAPRRELSVLLRLAVGSLVVAVGAVLWRVAGTAVAAAYAAMLLLAVLAGGHLVRRRARAAARARGRTCTCCTSSVHDPIQVI